MASFNQQEVPFGYQFTNFMNHETQYLPPPTGSPILDTSEQNQLDHFWKNGDNRDMNTGDMSSQFMDFANWPSNAQIFGDPLFAAFNQDYQTQSQSLDYAFNYPNTLPTPTQNNYGGQQAPSLSLLDEEAAMSLSGMANNTRLLQNLPGGTETLQHSSDMLTPATASLSANSLMGTPVTPTSAAHRTNAPPLSILDHRIYGAPNHIDGRDVKDAKALLGVIDSNTLGEHGLETFNHYARLGAEQSSQQYIGGYTFPKESRVEPRPIASSAQHGPHAHMITPTSVNKISKDSLELSDDPSNHRKQKQRKSLIPMPGPEHDHDHDQEDTKALTQQQSVRSSSPVETQEIPRKLKRRRKSISPESAAAAKRAKLSEDQKRKNHTDSEQRRRNGMKQGFDDLAKYVPSLQAGGMSRAQMLERTVIYLESVINGNKVANQMLEQRLGNQRIAPQEWQSDAGDDNEG